MDAWPRQQSPRCHMASPIPRSPMEEGWSPSPTSPSLPHHDPWLGRRSRAQSQNSEIERKHQQLKGCVQRLRAARVPGYDPGSVDAAFDEFSRVRGEAGELARALVTAQRHQGRDHGRFQSRGARRRNGSVQETVERLEMLRLAPGGNTPDDGGVEGLMAAFGNMGIVDAPGAGRPRSRVEGGRANAGRLATIRDWKAAIQKLLDSHRSSLEGMYRTYEKDATPEVVERLFNDPEFRAGELYKMRTGRAPLVVNGSAMAAAYWPTQERRFWNYGTLREAVMEVDMLLRSAEAGVEEEGRVIQEHVIVAGGDAVLEFTNLNSCDSPVLRFRVSSHMLAETSPIFKAVFQGQFSHPRVLDRHLRELGGQVPREPPRFVTCPDGTEVKLYSMPQLELNREDSLTVLLSAAHMQNDKIPREVSFAQFTAIAEVCLRYQCTSPLEVVVEHRWLPDWVHMAIAEDQPDGLLLISYTFGLRRIFTRMSKTAVLNVVDEAGLRAKNWPEKIKEKVWAVRCAKMEQIYAACAGAVQEYFQPPTGQKNDEQGTNEPPNSTRPLSSLTKVLTARPTLQSEKPPPPSYSSLFSLTSTPRCPKGSHWCDAANLGWLLLVLNELQLLRTVINPSALPHGQETESSPPTPRSLAQLLDVLRSIPGPPQPVHPGGSGICDPVPAFRTAVNDIYNSISGLTLFDVDGKRHGWALSRHSANDPRTALEIPLGAFGKMTLEDKKTAPAHVMDHVDADGGTDSTVGASLRSSSEASDDIDGGDNDQRNQVDHSPATFAPDDAICLRIMSSVDNFDGLHALAMTNRTFYVTFKQNELSLMRGLVRANRRLTLNRLLMDDSGPLALPGTEQRDDDKVLLQAQATLNTPTPGSGGASQNLVDEHYSYTADGSVQHQHQHQQQSGEKVKSRQVEPRSWGHEGPADDQTMTEEEAHRILWPDWDPDPRRDSTGRDVPAASTPFREDSDDKFLVSELSIIQAAEEKALAVLEEKNLREELDRRKGITSE